VARGDNVLGGVLGSYPALVFVKGYIEHPAQAVFNVPMGADIGEHLPRARILRAGEAKDIQQLMTL